VRHHARLTLVALLVFGTSFAHAAESCDKEKDSIDTCYQHEYEAARGAARLAAETQENADIEKGKKEAAKAQTGAQSGGVATASTLTDLIPLFDAAGLLSSSNENEGTLALNLNFLLPVQKADKNTQLSLILNTSPEPLDQLVSAFAEGVRDARKDSLQKSINTLGDARAEFKWSLVNSHFGRDFTVARDRLAPLYEGAWARAFAPFDQQSKQRLRQVLTQLARDEVAIQHNIDSTTPFDQYPPEAQSLRAEATEAAIAAGKMVGEATRATQDELERSRVAQAAGLVEQQPQLLFSLSHDIRDSVVGPEKTSATVTWEWTTANLSSFLGGPGAICNNKEAVRQGGDEYLRCAEALGRYIGDNSERLKTQSRWKLAASYHRVKAINYSFPDDNVTLNLPKTERIEVSAGWGRPLLSVKNADRIDVEVAYDSNIDNDTSNKERFKAIVTYTRRVGDVDLPFAIVYANKDEFLGEVDHQISLHLGLKFKPPAPGSE
jgi:hypothetical protein